MNRKEVAELLPIIKAFGEGKTIEQRCAESWVEVDRDCDFHFPASSYRIKPEPKYRPFKNAEECQQEMQKHQPFGLIRGNSSGYYKHINNLYINNISFQEIDNFTWSLLDLLKSYTFADGTPFGIKEQIP